jgi:predicted  nucleic acid-binding Zn-ribbon protein
MGRVSNMEERKYEVGRVEISSTEYRDLVKEAVEARRDASDCRSEKWKVERERDNLKKELESATNRIAELESVISNLHTLRDIPAHLLNYQSPSVAKREEVL